MVELGQGLSLFGFAYDLGSASGFAVAVAITAAFAIAIANAVAAVITAIIAVAVAVAIAIAVALAIAVAFAVAVAITIAIAVAVAIAVSVAVAVAVVVAITVENPLVSGDRQTISYQPHIHANTIRSSREQHRCPPNSLVYFVTTNTALLHTPKIKLLSRLPWAAKCLVAVAFAYSHRGLHLLSSLLPLRMPAIASRSSCCLPSSSLPLQAPGILFRLKLSWANPAPSSLMIASPTIATPMIAPLTID